jgi:integrase
MSIRQRDQSIDPKKPQKWQILIETGFDAKGNRKRSYNSFFGTHNQAQKEEARLMVQAEGGALASAGKTTVAEVLNRFYNFKKDKWAIKTALRNEGIIRNHLIPGLGHYRVDKLTAMHIDEFIAKERSEGRIDTKKKKGQPDNKKDKKTVEPGLSESSLKQAYNILSAAMEKAIDWDLIKVNPCRKVEKPKVEDSEVSILDTKEVLPMLEVIRGKYIFMPAFISVYTGMRLGEILALTWKDVDLKNKLLYVTRSSDQVKADEPHYKGPKTKKGKRAIGISRLVVDELKRHKKFLSEMRLASGGEKKDGGEWEENNLICPRWDDPGRPINPNSLSGSFSETMEKLGYPITFHGLRHTHASLLIQAKEQPKVISDRLGHTNIGITMDTYGHLMPGMQQEAANKLEDLLHDKVSKHAKRYRLKRV